MVYMDLAKRVLVLAARLISVLFFVLLKKKSLFMQSQDVEDGCE